MTVKISHLKDSDNGPQEAIKIFPFANSSSIIVSVYYITELASKKIHPKDATKVTNRSAVKSQILCQK